MCSASRIDPLHAMNAHSNVVCAFTEEMIASSYLAINTKLNLAGNLRVKQPIEIIELSLSSPKEHQ